MSKVFWQAAGIGFVITCAFTTIIRDSFYKFGQSICKSLPAISEVSTACIKSVKEQSSSGLIQAVFYTWFISTAVVVILQLISRVKKK